VYLFSSLLSQFKKYHPSGNLKFNNNLIISAFPKLEIAYFSGKNPSNFSRAKFYSQYFGQLWGMSRSIILNSDFDSEMFLQKGTGARIFALDLPPHPPEKSCREITCPLQEGQVNRYHL